MRVKNYYLVSLLFLLLYGCQSPMKQRLELALDFAGENRAELEKVLLHYANDSLKLEAARFLIINMPRWYSYEGWQLDTLERVQEDMLRTDTLARKDREKWQGFNYHRLTKVYDAQVIRADYLIENIDMAFKEWRGRPWNRTLPFDDFCELILPYRIGNEPLSDWRRLYHSYYGAFLDSAYHGNDVLEACCVINKELNRQSCKYKTDLHLPHQNGVFLFHHRIGYCREVCDLAIYAMRACGIPVAVDFMLYSPEYQNAHEWNVVRDTTGRFILFGFDGIDPARTSEHGDGRKKGKVFRYCYAYRPERMEWASVSGSLLGGEESCYWKDVTAEYFGGNRIEVPIETGIHAPIWLAVFSPQGWRPIDTGICQGKKVIFRDVEPEAIYIPVSRKENGELLPVGYAFIPKADGSCHMLCPDTGRIEPVCLSRKMPVLPRMRSWEYCQVGARLEGGRDSNFQNPHLIGCMNDTIRYTYDDILPVAEDIFRYVRYNPPQGGDIQVMELQLFSDTQGKELIPLIPVNLSFPEHKVKRMIDGDWVTGFYASKPSCGLTFRLGLNKPIRLIRFSPRTDDNYVWKGDVYELLYQDGPRGWKSLGIKQAEGRTVSFDAPRGALLWLRNRTKGREEQVFIWQDGKQWFASDL